MNKKTFGFGILVALALVGFTAGAATLHLAGDSTLCPRKAPDTKRSWGDALCPRLKDGHAIVNYAVSGTSTVTFRKVWEAKLLGQIKPGDFVIIQFGHNDCWHTEKRYAKPGEPDRFCTPDEYKANIKRFIAEVRARQATPIVLSPTPQRNFSKEGVFTGVTKRHKPYFDQLPALAAEEKVDYLDMTAIGNAVVAALGPDASKELFYTKYSDKDNVHPIESGARILAELFLVEARARKLAVAELFN